MLNHTIDLINENYNTGLDQLIEQHTEVAAVITELRDGYFGETGPTVTNLKALGEKFEKLVMNNGHLFIKADFGDIGKLIESFEDTNFKFRNFLTIPVTDNETHKNCTCNVNRFWKSNEIYVAFFTHNRGRGFNYTTLLSTELTNQYPANWSNCFTGTLVEAYETIMKICCGHQEVILDPFMYDAAVGEAAIKADRYYIGIEGTALYKQCYKRLNELGE